MSKKLLSILVAAGMTLSLAACGGSSADKTAAPGFEDKPATTAAETSEAKTTEEESTTEETTAQLTFEECVIVDQDGFLMKATDASKGFMGYELKIYIENNSDKNVVFSVDKVSVDGIMSDPFWAETVTAGSKSVGSMTWYDDLSKYGIDMPTVIEGTLRIYDDDTWDDYYEAPFRITPYGEENVNSVERTQQETDIVLMDNEYATITLTGIGEDIWGYNWELYIVNKTENSMMVSLDDVAIDGIMCDPFWAEELSGGMNSLETVSWPADFDELGIDVPSVIEGELRLYNSDTYDDYCKVPVRVTPDGEENVKYVVREKKDSDVVLYEDDKIGFTCIEMTEDSLGDLVMKAYIQNKTDVPVMVSLDDVSLNGFMSDPFWAETIMPGKVSYANISWYDDSLSDAGINSADDVETLNGTLKVTNDETWDNILSTSVTYTK